MSAAKMLGFRECLRPNMGFFALFHRMYSMKNKLIDCSLRCSGTHAKKKEK